MSADLRGRARGPGACAEAASGMGGARCGQRSLSALLPRGGGCGDQAHAWPPCSRGITSGQSTPGRPQGYGHRAWPATHGLQSLDHRGQPPGFYGRMEGLLEPLEACRRLRNRTDVFWKNDGGWGRGTDTCRAPPQGGRAPMGPARVAHLVSAPKGCETAWGVLAITARLCTRSGAGAHGCIVPLRDLDRRELACASEASPLQSVSAVCFAPSTRLVRHEGGGHHPAVVGFFPERSLAPGATGASRRDNEEVLGLRSHLADHLLDGTLAAPNGAPGGARGAMIVGDIRYGNRLFVDIHADAECARLRQG